MKRFHAAILVPLLLLASCVTERKGNQPQAGPQPQTVVVGKETTSKRKLC